MKHLLKFILIALSSSLFAFNMNAPIKGTLIIDGFDSDKGKVFVEVLSSADKTVNQLVLPISGKKVSTQIELPSNGKYAIQVFHDENNNKKMDKNFIGYPTEKWGTSNNAHPKFRAPKLKEMLTEVADGFSVKITVR